MIEPTLARPSIDPTLKTLLDAFTVTFNDAGVPAELSNEPNMVHGYVSFAPVIPAAAEATRRGLVALKNALHSETLRPNPGVHVIGSRRT